MRFLGFIVMFSFMSVCSKLHAGGFSVGNGGDGYIVDDKVYLWDLVERSQHLNPNMSLETEADPEILNLVDSALSNIKDLDSELLAKKITAISQKDYLFGIKLQYALKALSWAFAPLPLLDIKDEDNVINVPKEKLVQLAVRQDSDVLIDMNEWAKLDDANRVALVLHEALYFMLKPEKFGGIDSGIKRQDSRKVRSFVGHLFSPAFSKAEFSGLAGYELFSAGLPAGEFRRSNSIETQYFKWRDNLWSFYAGAALAVQVANIGSEKSTVLMQGEFLSLSAEQALSENTVLMETLKKACITAINNLSNGTGVVVTVASVVPIGAFFIDNFVDEGGNVRLHFNSTLGFTYEEKNEDGEKVLMLSPQSNLGEFDIRYSSSSKSSLQQCVQSVLKSAEKAKDTLDEFYK